jgi:hypothetical protein
MKIGLAIEQVADAEAKLVDELVAVGERHRTDHDVFHVTRTLAKLENGHVEALAAHADRYGTSIDGDRRDSPGEPGPLHRVVEKSAELIGRRPEPALLLLRDLREIYLLASETSIDWVMLAQGSQAVKDTELLDVVSKCHDETLRTVKWATYRIKTASPQALAAG